MLHISIKPEVVAYFFGFPITNSFLTSFLLLILFTIISVYYYIQRSNTSSFVFFIRFVTGGLYKIFEQILGEKTDKFFPLLSSFFLFILLSNWLGLVPGVGSIVITPPVDRIAIHESEVGEREAQRIPLFRAATADLNMTVGLALLSVALAQYYGIRYVGFKGYISRFINISSPIAFFTGILEIVSEFSKVLSFAFRLFGNIFAGEVLLVVIAFLIPILASFPFLLLEVFVGFIQALVFAMLSAVFIQMATLKHH